MDVKFLLLDQKNFLKIIQKGIDVIKHAINFLVKKNH